MLSEIVCKYPSLSNKKLLNMSSENKDKLVHIIKNVENIVTTIGIPKFYKLSIFIDKEFPNYLYDIDFDAGDEMRFHIGKKVNSALDIEKYKTIAEGVSAFSTILSTLSEIIHENFISFAENTVDFLNDLELSKLDVLCTSTCIRTCINGAHTDKCKSGEGDFMLDINII